MASSINLNSNYKTTTTTGVYSILSENSSPIYVGYFDGGKVLHFSKTSTVKGVLYGCIDNLGGPTYMDKITGTYKSAVGYYVPASLVQVTNDSGKSSASFTDKNGNSQTLSGIQIFSSPAHYIVKSGHTADGYSGPSTTQYNIIKTYSGGQNLPAYASYVNTQKQTWIATNSTLTTWVYFSGANGVRVSYILDKNAETVAANPNIGSTGATTPNVNSYGSVTDAGDLVYGDINAALEAINSASYTSRVDENSLEGLHNMQYVIGIPPKITRTADIPYLEDASPGNNFGRCYTEMFMMANTLFSIQPCKVKYLPGMNDDEKNTFFSYLADSVTGLDQDAGLKNGDNINLSGQLFEAQPNYNDYINTVNMLARAMAIYMGIGEDRYMNTGKKYKEMDYSFYKMKDRSYRYTGSGIMGSIMDAVRWTGNTLVTSVINDDTYLHFYMTADGTSVNENMSVSTKSTGLESLFNNNLSEIAQEIQFLGGGSSGISFENAIADATSTLTGSVANMGGIIGDIVKYGGNYLQGGRLVFPQMMDDCTYDRSYSGTCRFISPSGDPEAIFLNCYLPLCYLLPYVLPQMLSDNMYTYPFLARVDAKGLYHCDLAAITGLRIQRGGQDGTQFTADGLPFEVDVSFDVTPLYSKLMVTSTRHPILFLSNTSLHEYLGAMCGVSFIGSGWELKLATVKALMTNYITDTIPSMLRGYYSSDVANWLRKLFNFR